MWNACPVESDALNFFLPFRRLEPNHENQLTRALLVGLRWAADDSDEADCHVEADWSADCTGDWASAFPAPRARSMTALVSSTSTLVFNTSSDRWIRAHRPRCGRDVSVRQVARR